MREIIRHPDHDRRLSLGWLCLAWLEHFAVHGPGDVQGHPLNPSDPDGLPLDDEFAGMIIDHYALDSAGKRLYTSAFTSRAKGRAKSELAAFEVLFEAFGPARFERFAEGGEVYEWRDFRYEFQPGEPIGREIVYPYIRCIATEESQAGNTYDNVYYNLTEGQLGEGLPNNAAGLTRVLLPHGGEIVPSSSSSSAKDGGKETHVVFDETHLYILPELRRMYDTVRRNLGSKRKDAEPWSHETSTMYLPGENSVAEDTHKLALEIHKGKIKRPRLFFDHRQAPNDVDLTDEASLLAALKETYGPFSEVMDLQRKVDEIWDPRNAPGDSRRYHLNQPTSATDAFIADFEWKACFDVDKVVKPGDMITIGFDGSRGRAKGKPDATALIGCRLSDGHLFELGVWEAENGPLGEGWEPPIPAVESAIAHAFSRYKVVAAYMDPARDWRSHIDHWEAKYGRKIKVRVSTKHPFEWWMTGGRSHVNQLAIEQFEGACRNGDMTHSGGYALTQHVLNARRRLVNAKLTLSKEHDYSPNKIDACVAAVLAWQARLDAIGKGIGKRTTSVPIKAR